MNSKTEYKIPGLEGVGIPGQRNLPAVKKIEEVVASYKDGKGVTLTDTGKPATASEIGTLDPSTTSELINLPTSMSDTLSGMENSPYFVGNIRRDAIMPPLYDAKVVVVGLGGGAPIPVELAKCGVRQFRFFDYDVLEAENLIRHPCGVKYIGLPKVQAVADFLSEQTGDYTRVEAFQENVFDSQNIAPAIDWCDLLIVATDNETSRFHLNELAVSRGKPALFVGTFEGGMGGEIFAGIPGEGCYCCLAEHIGRKQFINEYVKSLKKENCTSARDTSAMPGLGVDQGIICLIAARKALNILLQNKNHSLKKVGENWIVFSICGIHKVLANSLSSIQHSVPKHASCMSCNSQAIFSDSSITAAA